jgi:hypothetical protein
MACLILQMKFVMICSSIAPKRLSRKQGRKRLMKKATPLGSLEPSGVDRPPTLIGGRGY